MRYRARVLPAYRGPVNRKRENMKCATCDQPTVGKSKYCREHRELARAAWKARIAADGDARAAKVAGHVDLWGAACRAASAAWEECTPAAMVVVDPGSGQRWHVSEGVCGFASVVVRPGNSSFARWLSGRGVARPHYYGGVAVSVYDIAPASKGSQSYDRKVAAARAAADVLAAAGLRAYVDARLD